MRLRFLMAASMLAMAAGGAAQAQQGPWTGPYIGGALGYGFQEDRDRERLQFDTTLDGSFNDTVRTPAGADAFGPGFCGGAAVGDNAGAGCRSDSDGTLDVAIRVGYDWQFDNWVLGVVGEFANANVTDAATGFTVTPASYVFSRKLRNVAALRARAGYAMGDSLGYLTGGVAYGDIRNSFATTNTANSFTVTRDDDAWGYQLGGGYEHRVSANWTLGVEYLFTQLNDARRYVVRAGDSGTTPPTNPFLLDNPSGTDMRRSENYRYNQLRVTASYRF